MTLTAFFQYRLAIAERKGYAREVSFNIDPSAGAPLPINAPQARSVAVKGERSDRQPTYHPQVHRANRQVERAAKYSIFGLDDDELSAEQLKKRIKNRAYHQRKLARMAKAQLVLWPTKES